MRPILFELFGIPVPSYAVFVILAFLVGWLLRRHELRRLGWEGDPRHFWLGVGGLVAAVFGAKVGMLLFLPPDEVLGTWGRALSLDFTGKTVLGGIAGGYLGVEISKRMLGLRVSTGDAWVLALPVAQAIGRVGCFLHGCCYGGAWDGPFSVHLHGAFRHPAPLYEAILDLLLVSAVLLLRDRGLPRGHLFKLTLVGYALGRFVTEFFRGDPAVWLGPLKASQWFCLLAAAGFAAIVGSRSQRY